jgi:D-glycero-beta-D-manno-heptose-7-phosphate kinase
MNLITQDRFQHLLKHFTQTPLILVVGDVGVDKYTSGEVRRISP